MQIHKLKETENIYTNGEQVSKNVGNCKFDKYEN